ncbi:MAG: hypothetical protein KDA87_14105 [Planctomycetales bacterium]|nr:hypothetical protein [Planctomycetales bacterium]
MSNFEDRLSKAIERGKKRSSEKQQELEAKALSEDELRQLHTRYRLQLSEHIEKCVNQLPNHFPGFQLETIYGEKGWGAAASRDDVGAGPDRRRSNFFSRLEMTIRPFSSYHVVELAAKGTIRNKEVFNRNHFELVQEVDADMFLNFIDVWVLEYAELFAAQP